jgi:DNA invertase Pin-like site-specific DNA recombinase
LQIVKQVLDAGATIRVLDFPSLDLTTPEGRGFLALFSAMAERERIRIVKRTQEGRRLAIESWQAHGPQTEAYNSPATLGTYPLSQWREHPGHR